MLELQSPFFQLNVISFDLSVGPKNWELSTSCVLMDIELVPGNRQREWKSQLPSSWVVVKAPNLDI